MERRIELADGRQFFVRPVRPEDESLYGPFFEHVSDADLRLRLFAPVRDFSHAFIARLTQIDYARATAFVAIDQATGELAGVVRLHADANYEIAEYAILLRSDLKGHGLGWKLMQLMVDYARKEGFRRIHGQVLHGNFAMLRMCQELGFDVRPDPEDPGLNLVSLTLADAGRIADAKNACAAGN